MQWHLRISRRHAARTRKNVWSEKGRESKWPDRININGKPRNLWIDTIYVVKKKRRRIMMIFGCGLLGRVQ